MEEKTILATWDTYRSCWSTTDDTERLEKLKKVLTENAIYRDPMVELTGCQAISAYMAEFQKQYSGAWFETADIIAHHGRSITHWHMMNEQKEVLSNGSSFAEYELGKIKQVNGFFKPA